MDKKSLSERDICTKFITPALENAGWDKMEQVREEVSFTAGPIRVRGNMAVHDTRPPPPDKKMHNACATQSNFELLGDHP